MYSGADLPGSNDYNIRLGQTTDAGAEGMALHRWALCATLMEADRLNSSRVLLLVLINGLWIAAAPAQQIPYAQDKPPGPALTPAQAIAKMTVPPGFEVKLFASEPDLVNPVAMAFDERGRVWVTESVEYPRKPAGIGRDRIKILEDTDGDGKADKVTIFADGLNIPSGIALGNGGVYVANAPDILFLRDTNGDDKADSREVLVTGFARKDTHELPSCLTWGPDGWLYGLNGVFNHSDVIHQGKTHKFNCALWRLHPKSRAFELFAQGTSNPYGLDYNRDGEFFVTACVIDHLWHLTETGYYHRQSGAYPPFTWKIDSIVNYKHQKAAYCGLCQYDADVYPPEYRGTLFMGNLHGSCINNDSLERQGASYQGKPRPDFLSAHDAWFMPVVQKVGPDGCLWILDWYDRYHCYQDANRDPAGIDRLNGRLYRVTYKGTPMAPKFDLRTQSDAQLVELLGNANVYFRRWARQLLMERGTADALLESLVATNKTPAVQRMEALWTLVSLGRSPGVIDKLLAGAEEPRVRGWAIRAAAQPGISESTKDQILIDASHHDPSVRTQAVIATAKCNPSKSTDAALAALSVSPADQSGLLPRIAWKHMEPGIVAAGDKLATWLAKQNLGARPDLGELLPRIIDRLLADAQGRNTIFTALRPLLVSNDPGTKAIAADCLERLIDAAIEGRFDKSSLAKFQPEFDSIESAKGAHDTDPRTAVLLAVRVLQTDARAKAAAATMVASKSIPNARRTLLFRTLITTSPEDALTLAFRILAATNDESDEFLLDLLSGLGRTNSPQVAERLIASFGSLRPSIRAQTLDLLSSRSTWAKALLAAVADKRIPTAVVNVNQIRKMRNMPDAECKRLVAQIWGAIREERNRAREMVVDHYEEVVAVGKGNAAAGAKVFTRVCAQCHQYRGEGYAVGPSLNENGRSNLMQLLSNILDPNLVIGKDYQAHVVVTTDGRVVTGLVAEDSPTRVVLKVAGGKLETFNRGDIEQFRESKISLMPEEQEKQMTDQEFRDLVAYLLLDAPASKANAVPGRK